MFLYNLFASDNTKSSTSRLDWPWKKNVKCGAAVKTGRFPFIFKETLRGTAAVLFTVASDNTDDRLWSEVETSSTSCGCQSCLSVKGHQHEHSKPHNSTSHNGRCHINCFRPPAAQLLFTFMSKIAHRCLLPRAFFVLTCTNTSCRAQIQHTREGTGGCAEHTSILLYTHWITAAHALFPCSLGDVLRFEIFVPEMKAHPGPLLIGHPGQNTPPLGSHFCFCASQSGNSMWQQNGRSRRRRRRRRIRVARRKEDPLQRSVKKEIAK